MGRSASHANLCSRRHGRVCEGCVGSVMLSSLTALGSYLIWKTRARRVSVSTQRGPLTNLTLTRRTSAEPHARPTSKADEEIFPGGSQQHHTSTRKKCHDQRIQAISSRLMPLSPFVPEELRSLATNMATQSSSSPRSLTVSLIHSLPQLSI